MVHTQQLPGTTEFIGRHGGRPSRGDSGGAFLFCCSHGAVRRRLRGCV